MENGKWEKGKEKREHWRERKETRKKENRLGIKDKGYCGHTFPRTKIQNLLRFPSHILIILPTTLVELPKWQYNCLPGITASHDS